MRKIIFIFIFFVFIGLPELVSAQEKNSGQYYQDLLENYRYYQSLIEPFNTAKSRHQTYQSVSAQAELLEACKKLMSSETESIYSYTLFIKTLLAEATKVINYHENYLYIKLDDGVAFLNLTKKKIISLSSLEETDKLTKEIAGHYRTIGQIGYQIKSIILLGSMNKIFENAIIDKDKIDIYLSDTNFGESKLLQVNASKEKFANTNKEIASIEELLTQASKAQKTEVHNDQRGISEQINKLVGQAAVKVEQVIISYKNIIFGLE